MKRPFIYKCDECGKEHHTIASEIDGCKVCKNNKFVVMFDSSVDMPRC